MLLMSNIPIASARSRHSRISCSAYRFVTSTTSCRKTQFALNHSVPFGNTITTIGFTQDYSWYDDFQTPIAVCLRSKSMFDLLVSRGDIYAAGERMKYHPATPHELSTNACGTTFQSMRQPSRAITTT